MCVESNSTEILIPTLVAVVGWLVAGWYAVRQVNLAHEKNRDLQKEQDERSILSEMYKQFLKTHLDTSIAITKFQSTMGNIHMNMMLNENFTNESIRVDWESLVIKLEQCHGEVGSQMQLMKALFTSTKPYLPDNSDIQDAFKIYKDAFTFESIADKPYIKMHALLEGMLQAQNNNSKLFLEHMKPVQKVLKELSDKLETYAQSVQEKLIAKPNRKSEL